MRRGVWLLGIAMACFAAVAAELEGQQEVQVALDAEGRLEVMDRRLAERLQLFQEHFPEFHEARLLVQLPDSTHVLEITSVEGDRTVRERTPLSPSEVEELRQDISRRMAERAPTAGLDREGRPRLVGGATLLGLGFYGWAVPAVLDVDDTATSTGLYMLTAGASFVGPWLATRRRGVTRGTADLALYGGTRGVVHGLLADVILDPEGTGEPGSQDADFRRAVGLAMGFSLLEGGVGWAWAHQRGLSLGTTRTVGMTGDFGMVQGLSLGGLLDPADAGVAGLTLAGAAVGVGLGPSLAARRDYSAGDVTVMSTAGYLGTYTGLALADLARPEEDRWYAAGAMVGSLAGLAVGDRLVRPYRFSEGQGRLLSLGTVAGGAVGLGVAHLIVGNDQGEDESRVYLASSALGATAGYGFTFRSLAPDADRRENRGAGLELQLNPVGAAAAVLDRMPVGGGGLAVPVLHGSYRF